MGFLLLFLFLFLSPFSPSFFFLSSLLFLFFYLSFSSFPLSFFLPPHRRVTNEESTEHGKTADLVDADLVDADLVDADMNFWKIVAPPSLSIAEKPAKTMAEIELFDGWALWLSASATHRQTGWGLHQRRWSNDAYATPQRRPCPSHGLAWILTDFLSEQRRATGLVETGVAVRAGGKRHPAQLGNARARLKINLK